MSKKSSRKGSKASSQGGVYRKFPEESSAQGAEGQAAQGKEKDRIIIIPFEGKDGWTLYQTDSLQAGSITKMRVPKGSNTPNSPNSPKAEKEDPVQDMIDLAKTEEFKEYADGLFSRYEEYCANGGHLDDKEEPLDLEQVEKVGVSLGMAALISGWQPGTLQWDNWDELKDAYSKLKLLAGQGCQVPLYIFSAVCLALERYGEGWKAFTEFMEKSGADGADFSDFPADLLNCQVNFPLFSLDFSGRIQMCWRLLAELSPELMTPRKGIRKTLDSALALQFLYWHFKDRVDFIANFSYKPLKKYLRSQKDTIPLYFESDLFELDLLPIMYAMRNMPDSLQETWQPSVGRPPLKSIILSFVRFLGIRKRAVRIRIADSPDHTGADLLIFHKKLRQEADADLSDAKEHALSLASAIVGSAPAFTNIRSITIPDSELSRSSTRSIRALPKLLRRLGYPEQVSAADMEKKLHRTYTRSPSSAAETLRADIILGWTDCMQLQEEYEQGADNAYFHYVNQGIAAVFAACPRSLLTGTDQEFYQQLTQHLNNTGCAGEYRVIGEASGAEYCYLDLLLWSEIPVLQALQEFFQGIPGGDMARIQAFRRASPAFPADLECIKAGLEEALAKSSDLSKTDIVPGKAKKGRKGSKKRI